MSLLNTVFRLAQPLVMATDAEFAHKATIELLKRKPPCKAPWDEKRLEVKAFGLTFPNPVGMAAGFDKGAEVPDALLGLGFGFVEVGGVTPRPQPGNPRPRVFRLPDNRAVINRYGLNSEGMAVVAQRLKGRMNKGGIVGVNIGPNKDSTDRIADFAALVAELSPFASYVSINVSSPNTPGLRDLQQVSALDEILARAVDARDNAAPAKPVLLKIAPDLALADLDDIVAVARKRRIDGMIVSNTTIARPESLRDRRTASETGGLSGAPLFEPSTRMLAETFLRVERAFPLIGVGGITSAQTAFAKIEAGASLIQLYTALIYEGHALVNAIKQGLLRQMSENNVFSLDSLIGRQALQWTRR